jgi:DNA-binding MarR family transcriptional regulator
MEQDYSHDLLLLLHDVARLTRVEADRRARDFGMTRAQWALLLRVARLPGQSQRELADMLEVEPITVARLVDRMVANGLVERRADVADRRIWRLHLCPAAHGLLATIQQQRDALFSFVTAGIPPHMQASMVAALQQMKTNLTQAESPMALTFQESA